MERTLKIEEFAMFGFSIYLFWLTDFAWWWYPALILVPDIGMLGYLVNRKVGAYAYNLFHHKAIGILLLCFGWYLSMDWLELAGIIVFGHSSMDRIFGYGLKYSDDFQHTHLGWLGHNPNPGN